MLVDRNDLDGVGDLLFLLWDERGPWTGTGLVYEQGPTSMVSQLGGQTLLAGPPPETTTPPDEDHGVTRKQLNECRAVWPAQAHNHEGFCPQCFGEAAEPLADQRRRVTRMVELLGVRHHVRHEQNDSRIEIASKCHPGHERGASPGGRCGNNVDGHRALTRLRRGDGYVTEREIEVRWLAFKSA